MKTKTMLALILALVVIGGIGIASWYMGTYNRLIKLDEAAKSAWAQVENQLQRRYDLVPNLVNTVKGYAQHEDKVFIAVTEARSKVGSARTTNEKIGAEGELSSALSRLLVVSENYPDLKANKNFLDLQAQLEGTENRIAVERKRYNDAVMAFNATIRGLLEQIIARSMKLEPKVFFKSDQAAQKAPEVHF